jgi:hypothetical protein
VNRRIELKARCKAGKEAGKVLGSELARVHRRQRFLVVAVPQLLLELRNTDYQSHKEEFSFRLQFTYRL